MLARSTLVKAQRTRDNVISVSYNDDHRLIALPSSYAVRRHPWLFPAFSGVYDEEC